MSTDIRHSKAQISKIIQTVASFGSWLAKFGKKALQILQFLWLETIYLD